MAEIDWFPKAKKPITISYAIGAKASYHNSSFVWKMHFGKPFATLTKTKTKALLILDNQGKQRFINLDELKIGGSFSRQYRFINYDSALSLIGNSVPPLMMRAIAGRIGQVFFGRDKMKTEQVVDYKAILDEAWQQHLAPREKDAPTFISTFSGCGGSSLGYSMAGFRELLAIEWNDNAVATFKLNFPGVPVYHGDIAKLSGSRCLELAGIEPGQLDLLDGSPPCQGFSTAGKRKMNDKRNKLYMEFVRLLRGLKPKVFVMENVSGLVKGKMKLIFAEIMRELKASGYKVRCKLLNAMYFNVPQSRQRLIWIGVREDLEEEPKYPKAENRPITVREALPHIRSVVWDPHGQFTPDIYGPDNYLGAITKSTAYQWEVEPESDISRFAIGREWDKLKPGESSDKYFNLVRPSLDKPCPALTKTAATLSAAAITHPTEKRKFSIAELKRIGAFPNKFKFAGGYRDAWAIVGNSVPPLFMRSLARHIKQGVLTNG